jgi:hypothetical protein
MKLKTIKPLYLGGKTLVEGTPFITDEQHGRQLLAKGFAVEHTGEDDPAVDLTAETPSGGALTSASIQKPALELKQLGHGNWIVVDAAGDQVGSFAGTKAEATAEVSRLVAGGEPLPKPATDGEAPVAAPGDKAPETPEVPPQE